MNYYITHFFYTLPPEEDILEPLTIIVATRESLSRNVYYLGYGGSRELSKEELFSEISDGSIIELPSAQATTDHQGLWIDHTGNILLANKENPSENKKKVFSIRVKKRIEHIYENSIRNSVKGLPEIPDYQSVPV